MVETASTDCLAVEPDDGEPRVLLIGDVDSDIKLLTKIVEKHGLLPSVTRTGTAALRLLEKNRFEIMIADVGLPDMDGIDLARQARELRPEMPILLMTDYKHQPRAREAAALLVAEYVLKPIVIGEVRARMDELLRLAHCPPLPGLEQPSPELPASKPDVATAKVDASTGEKDGPPIDRYESNDPASTADLRVVVVAAEGSHRREIASLLSDLGCNVMSFASFEQAYEVVLNIELDIVIADPEELSTWNSLLFARHRCVKPGLIAILGKPTEQAERTALDLGAHGVLAPPFEKSAVSAVLRFVISSILEERIAAANERKRNRR